MGAPELVYFFYKIYYIHGNKYQSKSLYVHLHTSFTKYSRYIKINVEIKSVYVNLYISCSTQTSKLYMLLKGPFIIYGKGA